MPFPVKVAPELGGEGKGDRGEHSEIFSGVSAFQVYNDIYNHYSFLISAFKKLLFMIMNRIQPALVAFSMKIDISSKLANSNQY